MTLKNFRNVLFVALALFAVISIYSEVRPQREEDYGRLYARNVPKLEVEVKTPAVVAETMPVDDVTSADPSSVQAAAREQILRADLPTPQADATDGGYQSTQRADGSRIQVVGGPEGVDIVQGERPRPVLGGGFGRQ